MRTAFRLLLPLLIVGLLLTPFGCGKNAGDTQGKAEGPSQDKPVDEIETLFDGPVVNIGDKVIVELTVTTPNHMYLNGPKPVSVKIPGDTIFHFSQNEYFVTKPVFPMKIDFEIPQNTPYSIHKIPLALQVMYCNKSDDICLIKNDFLNIEVKVEARTQVPAPRVHLIESTYPIK